MLEIGHNSMRTVYRR